MPERAAPAAAKADTLLLVGCGQMGSAMLRGWLARDVAAGFIAIEPAGLPSSFADATSIAWHAAAEELPDDLTPDAVVFAVKPQIINDVLPAYRRWVRPQTLFLSIAAGITISGIARHLGEAAIIRTMPNTPAAIGRGITVACANPLVTPEQRGLCEALLAAIGESAWVEDEALLDPVTAVSGSGPAYVFLLIEALAEAGGGCHWPKSLGGRRCRSCGCTACTTRNRRFCAVFSAASTRPCWRFRSIARRMSARATAYSTS